MTAEKVVHEGEDVSADSVPYILSLEYSNKPSESDEEIPPRVRGIALITPERIAYYVDTPACAGNSFAAVPPALVNKNWTLDFSNPVQ